MLFFCPLLYRLNNKKKRQKIMHKLGIFERSITKHGTCCHLFTEEEEAENSFVR
jgi:hypothetical protein